MSADRRRNADRGAARVAGNSYFKIAAPTIVSVLMAVIIFFLVRVVDTMDTGLKRINQNVTQIALNKDDIQDNASDISDMEAVNVRQWQRIWGRSN